MTIAYMGEFVRDIRRDTITRSYNLWIRLVRMIENMLKIVQKGERRSCFSMKKDEFDDIMNGFVYVCYRHGFPEIQGYTDDCGWGCTIRSAQMLIGNVCLRINPEFSVSDMIHSVGDTTSSVFSIQNIVSSGGKYGYSAGEWFTPSVAARSIKDVANDTSWDLFSIYVYPDLPKLNHQDGEATGDKIWERPVLLVLSSRFGLVTVDVSYRNLLLQYFSDSRCVGMVGGKKTSSYYFVGSDEHGRLLYLDPHELRDHREQNFRAKRMEPLSLDDIDPSLTLAFLISSKNELDDILDKFESLFDTVPSESAVNKTFQSMDEGDFCLLLEDEEMEDPVSDILVDVDDSQVIV